MPEALTRILVLGGHVGGALLIVLAAGDAFMTIFSQRGGGRITSAWSGAVWRSMLALHRRFELHSLLSFTGPCILIGTVLVWYLFLLTGWSIIFIAGDAAVIESTSGKPTDPAQRFYFTGTTLSGVGYGDLVPSQAPWTIVANFAAFTTSFLIATSISYIIPVISAALQRRQLAEDIHVIGGDAGEIVRMSWTGGNSAVTQSYWTNLFSALNRHAHTHLVYPVLHYFHALDAEKATSLGILRLADAIFLIRQSREAPEAPPSAFYRIADSALERYAGVKGRGAPDADPEEVEQDLGHLGPATLRECGLEAVDREAFDRALEDYLPLRAKLVRLCRDDGWGRKVPGRPEED